MIKKNLVVAVEKYTNSQGEEKTKWLTIGQLHEHDGREYITLDRTVNLSGIPPARKQDGSVDYRVFAQLFEPRSSGQQKKEPSGGDAGFDDDIPFMRLGHVYCY